MIEVTCAIIMKEGRTLLAQRSEKMSHPLQWEFPGGKLLPGESPEKCIKREILEELNVQVKVERLLPSVIHSYGTTRIKLIPFVCSIREGEIQLIEHKDYVWTSSEDMSNYNLLEADINIVKKLSQKPILAKRA